jgi:hypothetical protein
MGAVLKLHPDTREPEKRLVDQGSCLQRVALALLPHIVPSRPAKLVVEGDRSCSPASRSPRFHSRSRRVISGAARPSIALNYRTRR